MVPRALHKKRERLHEFANYLAVAYPVEALWAQEVSDSTLLCRCEEVSAGAMRAAIKEFGATDTRSAKLFTRAGMGWCQGRMCARVCSEFISQETGVNNLDSDLRSSAKRTIANPLPLGTVAHWTDGQQ